MHLISEELLVLHHLLLFGLLICSSFLVVLFSTLHPPVHVRLVSPGISLLSEAFLSHLLVQNFIKLLVLGSVLVLLIDIMQTSLFILFNALCNILFLLLQLEFFAIVFDNIAHAVHDCLNATTTISDLLLSLALLLEFHLHVFLNLLGLLLLNLFQLCDSLLLLIHVVFYYFHCSFTLLNFSLSLGLFLLLKVSCQLSNSLSLFVLASHLLVNLFLF